MNGGCFYGAVLCASEMPEQAVLPKVIFKEPLPGIKLC